MATVLAAIDATPCAGSVLATAHGVAELLHLSLRAIHVREDDDAASLVATRYSDTAVSIVDGDPASEIVRAVAAPDVVLAVVGSRGEPGGPRPAGHTAIRIVEQVDKPVVIVPPERSARPVRPPIRRALVPLEGTSESSDAVGGMLHRLSGAGVDVLLLHVFDADSAPRFWDQSAHAGQSYAAEFESRWCPVPASDLELRRGAAPATVIQVADDHQVDLIALGWRQDLAEGHAGIVRAALAHTIAVLLVPLASDR